MLCPIPDNALILFSFGTADIMRAATLGCCIPAVGILICRACEECGAVKYATSD